MRREIDEQRNEKLVFASKLVKRFYCDCGAEIFFENQNCGKCARTLGFDSLSNSIIPIEYGGSEHFKSKNGQLYRLCGNWIDFNTCNWLVPNENPDRLCYSCRFNRTIPDQTSSGIGPPKNFFRWYRLEEAKRRLLYTLLGMKFRLISGWDDAENGLLFDFLEDHQRDGNIFNSVTTGYMSGIITINSKEADDVERVQARSALNERQRTIVGHFRHELGHFCWDKIFCQLPLANYFEHVFGESNLSYKESIDLYYKKGPPKNWHDGFISAYASSHPSEDWAETWNHFLLIYDCLETACEFGLTSDYPSIMDLSGSILMWRELAVTLNQLNRSIGLNDAYPFIITRRVEEKLTYVAAVINEYTNTASANESGGDSFKNT